MTAPKLTSAHLLPCYCGAEPVVQDDVDSNGAELAWVACLSCNAETWYLPSEDEAVREWNRMALAEEMERVVRDIAEESKQLVAVRRSARAILAKLDGTDVPPPRG